jgi:hypothetical protein
LEVKDGYSLLDSQVDPSRRIAGPPAWRQVVAEDLFFFFSQRRKAAKKLWCTRFDFPPRRTGFGRQAQRNSGPLGFTSSGLGGFAFLRAILFFFFLRAKPACRQTYLSAPAVRPEKNSSFPQFCGIGYASLRPPRRIFFLYYADQTDLDAIAS